MACRDRRDRSTTCTSCWSRRRTASRTGERPPTRSTIAASSTSTRWPDCAWRTRRSSTRSIAGWRACSTKGASPGSASIIPTACSIRPGTSQCCRGSRAARMSSPRRSCRNANGCRPAGRSTARPATTSSTRSTVCSSNRRTRGGCARCT
jgi:hypothetical protein